MEHNEPQGVEINNERNSTTLEKCGWCKYATGSHRYNHCIEGSCGLQKSYSDGVVWSDVCKFKESSKSEIDSYIEYHNYTINDKKNSIKRHKEYIKSLKKLKKTSTSRPPLPRDRSCNHFNLNDKIAVYLEKEGNKWYFGSVVNGYRHHDGCVSYCLDGVGPQSNEFWGCGSGAGAVMLKSEWDFFSENLKQYEIWRSRTEHSHDISTGGNDGN